MQALSNEQQVEAFLSSKKKVADSLEEESKRFDDLQSLLSVEQKTITGLKRKLGDSCTGQTLILCDSDNNKDLLLALVKIAFDNGKKPVIVLSTLNHKSAGSFLSSSKIDLSDVFFIDPVSKSIQNVKETPHLLLVDSLMNLTQMQIKILKLIESRKDLVFIFDSIDVFELYHDAKVISKFINSVTKIMHSHKVHSFYLVSKKKLVPLLSQFFDNFVELEKTQ